MRSSRKQYTIKFKHAKTKTQTRTPASVTCVLLGRQLFKLLHQAMSVKVAVALKSRNAYL